MEQLLEKIDKYLVIQEKNDAIALSLKSNGDLKDIIEIVRKSNDKDKTLSMFNQEVREQIQKLIDGGIL
jgi:DNA-directed RNA polymerase subunit H (RpoH/RPB5)